jgi:N-acetylglutamate synthase-like GNAT family acetyltransferase
VSVSVRPATAGDQAVIVGIVRAARINPMDLKWPNFVVAVDDATGAVVGTGQVKVHRDGSPELASIATVPAFQHQGVAHKVIHTLLRRHPETLYLTCMDWHEGLYQRFGFRALPREEMPPYFRRLLRVAGALEFFTAGEHRLLVMKRDGDSE